MVADTSPPIPPSSVDSLAETLARTTLDNIQDRPSPVPPEADTGDQSDHETPFRLLDLPDVVLGRVGHFLSGESDRPIGTFQMYRTLYRPRSSTTSSAGMSGRFEGPAYRLVGQSRYRVYISP